MFKQATTIMAALVLMTSWAAANDDFLNELASGDTSSISDANNAVEADFLGSVDVAGLSANAGEDNSDEAVEACFRRFGYGHRGYNHFCGYGYGGYYRGYGCGYTHYTTYHHCYRPAPVYCYRPVQQYACVPVYHNYWGCY